MTDFAFIKIGMKASDYNELTDESLEKISASLDDAIDDALIVVEKKYNISLSVD